MISEDVMNILYLQWVEVTPQLCKFPSDMPLLPPLHAPGMAFSRVYDGHLCPTAHRPLRVTPHPVPMSTCHPGMPLGPRCILMRHHVRTALHSPPFGALRPTLLPVARPGLPPRASCITSVFPRARPPLLRPCPWPTHAASIASQQPPCPTHASRPPPTYHAPN